MGAEQTVPTQTWMDRELAGCKFKDVRLGKRFRKLFEQLSDGVGEYSLGLSGLGEREGGLPVFLQRAC